MRKTKKKQPQPVMFPLKAVLARYKLSQRHLSRVCGLDYNRVNDLANGRHLPTWPTVVKIATAIGASLGDFQLSEYPQEKKKPRPRKPRPRKSKEAAEPVTTEG